MLIPRIVTSASKSEPLKCPTGIPGFDQIAQGGLPRNRTTLLCGGTGSGKTLWGIEFLVNGAAVFNEPGILLSFEETANELYSDVESIGLDLQGLVSKGRILILHVPMEQKEIQESDFNLEGTLVNLEQAINSIGAKRVVLDSIESLLAGITDSGILRMEVKRLFRWFREKQVTALVTCENRTSPYSWHGIEEYLSDCLIFLDNRVNDQISIRRVRIVKYRGSNHGSNEYPFTINKNGLSVMPITSAALDRPGTSERVSTGIDSLDSMFGGRGGYTKGSSILVSGTAGTGKTSLAAAFALARCKKEERCLFLSYEESPGQLIQNMSSINLNLQPFVKKGLLNIVSTRPSLFGLEKHLLDLYLIVDEFKPMAVVIDPLTSLVAEGNLREVESMVTRMIDLLKSRGITAFFTSLVSSTDSNHSNGEIGISSLIDTWIVVREIEEYGSRRRLRGLFVVKSRGMSHSSDINKLVLSDEGLSLSPMERQASPTRVKSNAVTKSRGLARKHKQRL